MNRCGGRSAATTRYRSSSTGATPSGAASVAPAGVGRRRSCAAPTGERSWRSNASCARVAMRLSGSRPRTLEVLAGRNDFLDAPLLARHFARQRLHGYDALTLLAGDLRPVVGVRRIRKILVLLELFSDGAEELVGRDALLPPADVALEGELLGTAHDRLDHGTGGEVLEVQDLLVAVGVGDLEEAVLLAETVHRLHRRADHPGNHRRGLGAAGLRLGERDVRGQVLGEDVGRGRTIRTLDLDLHVEAARPEDGRIDEVLPVGGSDDDDVLEPLDAVDLGQELRHDGSLDVGRDPGAAGAEQRVHLVEEDDDRNVLGRLLLGLEEDLTDLPLGLTHVLVEELRALDVEEEALDLLAALLGDLLGEVIGHGLGDHGLAAAGRPVEQHALGRRELVLFVIVRVEVRQLHRVLDRFDLVAEAADVVVADVGHFLERQVFHFALRKLFQQVSALRVEEQVIAGLEAQRAQRLGDDGDFLLVGTQRDERALVVELLLEDDDLALDLVGG